MGGQHYPPPSIPGNGHLWSLLISGNENITGIIKHSKLLEKMKLRSLLDNKSPSIKLLFDMWSLIYIELNIEIK